MYVAPSLLSANFLQLENEIKAICEAGADMIHIDIMDGYYVPNMTFGPCVIKDIAKITNIPLDIHLMVEDIDSFIDLFIPLKPQFISFHIEVAKHPIRTCEYLRQNNIHPAIVLNPHTPIKTLEYLIDYVDMILLMSVNPGFGGQKFLDLTYDKIIKLKKIINDKKVKVFIEVDGGINGLNASKLCEAGADILVAGNYIFSSKDYKSAINSLKLKF